MSLEAGVPFGRYLLLRKLAIGGMAEVWLARAGEGGSGKPVVLKRILPQFAADPEFVARFREEAALTLSLVHGNIVPVFDVGTVGEDAYIAMEYLPGHDLRTLLKRSRERATRPPPGVAAWIIAEVLRGLDYAHRKSDASGKPLLLVHRDVSPSNIVVSTEGAVKLLDFGIAKAIGRDATRTGVLRGKVGYMSPEQARGEPISCASDLFSTGVVLYELLTAERLFDGESEPEILERVKSAPIPRVRDKVPAVPPELDAIVARSLERESARRYPTASEFHSALARVLYSGAVAGDAPGTAVFIRELFPEDAVALEQAEADSRTATHAGGGAAQIGPAAAPLMLGGALRTGTPATASAPAPAVGGPRALLIGALGAAVVMTVGVAAVKAYSGSWGKTEIKISAPWEEGDAQARIIADGVDHGKTPKFLSFDSGTHTVLLTRPDFDDYTLTIDTAKQEREYAAPMKVKSAGVQIESEPRGAEVVVTDHGGCSATPCKLALPVIGTFDVRMTRDGFEPFIGKIVDPRKLSYVFQAKLTASRTVAARTPTPVAAISAAPAVTATAPPPKGRVSFHAQPWGWLTIDDADKPYENTVMGAALEPGPHRIRVVNEPLHVDITCTFEVEAGADRGLTKFALGDGKLTAQPALECRPSKGSG